MKLQRLLPIFILITVVGMRASDPPKAVVKESSFQFGKVMRGAVVEHEFAISNAGTQPLLITNVIMSTPLRVMRMPASIAPGSEASLKFSLDTGDLGSFYEGMILVKTNDPSASEIQLTFDGNIVSMIEVSPMPAFYLAAQRGEAKEASVEIINHEIEPLRIERVESQSPRFTTRIQTVEEGKRYQLVLRMNPKAPLGKSTDTILVHTSSREYPVVKIGAHTYIRDQVYTFPLAVEFGEVRLTDLREDTDTPARSAQRLMVYESAGKDFQIRPSSDLAFLNIQAQRAPTGDRVQLFVTVDPKKVTAGNFSGSIEIETNDAKVPRLKVPVSITVAE